MRLVHASTSGKCPGSPVRFSYLRMGGVKGANSLPKSPPSHHAGYRLLADIFRARGDVFWVLFLARRNSPGKVAGEPD